jgi:hypothetical protein
MRRHTRTNLFLLATVVLLGVGAFAELRREHALERDPLTKIDPEKIKSLAVTCEGCATRRFEKENGHWMMREPEAKPVDDKTVERLTYIVRAPVRYRRPAGELDASKLGLDPPVATLEVDGIVLKFGTTDAIHNDRYVEVEGTIALVPDRFSALLFATPESDAAAPPPDP